MAKSSTGRAATTSSSIVQRRIEFPPSPLSAAATHGVTDCAHRAISASTLPKPDNDHTFYVRRVGWDLGSLAFKGALYIVRRLPSQTP